MSFKHDMATFLVFIHTISFLTLTHALGQPYQSQIEIGFSCWIRIIQIYIIDRVSLFWTNSQKLLRCFEILRYVLFVSGKGDELKKTINKQCKQEHLIYIQWEIIYFRNPARYLRVTSCQLCILSGLQTSYLGVSLHNLNRSTEFIEAMNSRILLLFLCLI